jgi:hypothetical protein
MYTVLLSLVLRSSKPVSLFIGLFYDTALNACTIMVAKLEGKNPLERSRHVW